jgi:hypothetical protein
MFESAAVFRYPYFKVGQRLGILPSESSAIRDHGSLAQATIGPPVQQPSTLYYGFHNSKSWARDRVENELMEDMLG